MLVNSKASTLCSFPESVTLLLHHFNLNLYNGGCEERNVAYPSSREWHPVCSLFPFTVLECIPSITRECRMDIHAAFPRNCLYSPIQRSPTEEHRFLFCIHHWSQNIDLVFGNAFPVFVACDSGGYSILTDFHLEIMMLVCIYALPDELVVDAKQTCPLHPTIFPSLSSILEQHDPISSIQAVGGSALVVMCALFLS